MSILVADPGESYRRLSVEIDEAVLRVLRSGWYILGESCRRFESAFANFCDVPFCIGVANGTDAVELALRAVGVTSGDFVVTVANTAVATVSAIERIGAVPVFVDVEPDTQTMAPGSLETVFSRDSGGKIKAVVPVHLFGHPCEMESILRLARHYRAYVVEDCAQAHGARYQGRVVGSMGDVGAFSFYPTKNLGAFGDGGAVVTRDEGIASRVRMLRQYGWRERYISETSGLNSRLDEMQAAVLEVKLRTLADDNLRRHMIAERYNHELQGAALILPSERSGCLHAFHQYVVRSRERDALAKCLKQADIGSAVLYPVPIHQQPAFCARYHTIHLPVTEELSKEILCLPMYPELTDLQVDEICNAILLFASSKRVNV